MKLNIEQKLELLQKLESDKTIAQVCDEYGCRKQTVSEIRMMMAILKKF